MKSILTIPRRTQNRLRRLAWLALALAGLLMAAPAGAEPPPFGMPFAGQPGPDTWLLSQAYGNTSGAYRQRNSTYRLGQGIHFGIDISAACGTTVVAIGDGVVAAVDGPYGSAPHNLMINHPNGYASLYGHLLERPRIAVGTRVERGQPVALSGDPDETCYSRPHLHLEIRDLSYRRAFNPIPLIDADWDNLTLAGGFGRSFQRDLDDPRRWQDLEDQPDIVFGGALLNSFARTWPPSFPNTPAIGR